MDCLFIVVGCLEYLQVCVFLFCCKERILSIVSEHCEIHNWKCLEVVQSHLQLQSGHGSVVLQRRLKLDWKQIKITLIGDNKKTIFFKNKLPLPQQTFASLFLLTQQFVQKITCMITKFTRDCKTTKISF